MKTKARPTVAAIAATVITTTGAFASEVEVVQGFSKNGQGGPISFARAVQQPRIATLAVFPYHRCIASSQQKPKLRCETISSPQGGPVSFYRPVE
jgi:hypothetical protein